MLTPDHTEYQEAIEIAQMIANIHPISLEASAYLMKHFESVKIKKGKLLHSPQDAADAFYFIRNGLVRGFLKDGEEEITTWISEENNIVGTIHDLGRDIITAEHIQALEHTDLIMLRKDVLEKWYEKYNEANTLGRKLLEIYYRDADERAYLCRLPSAEKRYRRFVQTRPKLLNRVGLRYLSSYLNMKEETLCRIRAKVTVA